MGVCQSGDVEAWGDDGEEVREDQATMQKVNKQTGELEDFEDNHPEEDFFEFEEEEATL
tara:strand:+ start:234 stop:410 length:177 start_codon:yes stop_codon:yes gene_type:complete